MPRDTYDVVIVGGGSAGCALANRLSADPSTSVLVLEAGRSDYPWDVFIHMPAALTFPSGSRFYDWRYESEPEPHMGGRRIPHARGKVLGGSSSINGMIFQRGNPLDYERWAADPGMATWDYAHCLPYFIRMENCLAAEADDEFRGHSGPLVLERGPATNPLLRRVPAGGEGGGLPAHRRRQRVPPGGLRPVRPQRPPRAAAVGGRRVPAPRDVAAQPRRPHGRPGDEGDIRRHPRGRRRVLALGQARPAGGRRRGRPVRRGDQLAAAAAAVGRGRARAAAPAGHPRGRRPARASARTSRTTWRSTCSTRARSRCRCSPTWPNGTGSVPVHGGSSCAAAPAPPTTSRQVASSAATTTSTTRT